MMQWITSPTARTTTGTSVLALAAVLCLTGCGSKDKPPGDVTLGDAPKVVRGAFDTAGTELKQAADEASQALADGAYDVSLGRISELSGRTDLSAAQREALAQSRIAVMRKLQEAAAAGDAKSAQVMELHRSTK